MTPRFTKRRVLIALAVLAPFAAQAELPAPAAPIAAFNDGLAAAMRAGKSTPFASRLQTLQPLVEKAFDLPLILQSSVGLRWSALSAPQQQELLEAFTTFTVATWVANFDTDDGDTLQILPDLRAIGADQVVQTRIVPKTGQPTRLDYVMRDVGGTWKAVDILVDGSISRVAVQRSDFRALLRNGDPAPLIAHLRDKAASLAAGSKS
jgi:phospholipid transport system substrate-binding protein